MPDDEDADQAAPAAEAVTPDRHQVQLVIFGDRGIGTDLLIEGFTAAEVGVEVDIYADTPTYIAGKEDRSRGARPELILIDLDRHSETAAPAIERLRADVHPKTPILVFSDIDDPETVDETYDHGATAYILKPTDPQEYRDYAYTIAAFWFGIVTTPSLE